MYLLAKHLLDKRDARALTLMRQAVENGNTKAMVEIGHCYAFGKDVPKDEAQAFDWYKKAADAGDGTGLLFVGRAYRDGKGRPKDEKTAVEYFEKARDAGELKACEGLYYIYTAKGPLFNEAKAFDALEVGRQRGSLECERMLAEDYKYKGDLAKALPMLEKCAELGASDLTGSWALLSLARHYLGAGNDPARGFGCLSQVMKTFRDFPLKSSDDAPVFYALCLFTGRGAAANPKAAMASLKMAAALGSEPALELLKTKKLKGHRASLAKRLFGDALGDNARADDPFMAEIKRQLGEALGGMPTPEVPVEKMEIDIAPHLDPVAAVPPGPVPPLEIIGALRERAEKGNINAMFRLAQAAFIGDGMAQDMGEAVMWLRNAGEKGHTGSQALLVDCYLGKHGIPESPKDASYWAGKAAMGGNVECQYLMGFFASQGKGMAVSKTSGFNWYFKAAQAGHAAAMGGLAGCYLAGQGVTKSEAEAFKWATKAAQLGDAHSQFVLGGFFENGWGGIAKNPGKAGELYRLAAAQGHAKARAKI
jgi:TPR repeat protein